MTIRIAALVLLGGIMLARADQSVERVQQALKDQGFYYGEVSGEMNANLAAAIRRYQIRNGLQVSGELSAETLQSLGIDSSGAARPATKAAPSSPAAPAKPDEQSPRYNSNANPTPPIEPFGNAPQDQQVYPSAPVTPGVATAHIFAGTPFEAA